ncbi:hypothetical protein [Seonamhaeicola sp.]|uniref:hypothetical protein n=1 Tax=Seonamhaeicola sp. TaxID=1912245 RepID=UPI003561C3F3
MPHFFAGMLVVTLDEIIPRFWSSYKSLERRLRNDAERGYGIERTQRGGGLDTTLLIKFDSLPKRYQDEIGDPRKDKHPLSKFYKVEREIVDYYNDYQYPDGTYLIPETVEQLIINASVLKAIVKLEAARESERLLKGGSLRGIAQTLYTDCHAFNAELAKDSNGKLQHNLNSSFRRFKQQLKAFKENSYYTLIKDPEGLTKKNALKRDDKVNKLLNDLFAGRTHKPTATEVAREYEAFLTGYIDVIHNDTGEVYNPKEYKSISNRTITNYLSTYESKIGTYAKRSGDRQKLMQDVVPYHSLEQPHFAGSMISIDDRQPPFWYDKNKRMWWYLAIDLASECITAWAYGKTKEELILNFYKNLVANYHAWNLPLPDALECESSLNSSFKDTFLAEGAMFKHVQIHPNSARSKRIERYFKNLRYEIEKEQEGWIARPFALAEANQAGPGENTIIPYQTLVAKGFANIQTWNNMPNKQDPSISRFDYFMQRQHPDLQPTNYKSFIKHLGEKTETSCKAGIMKLQAKKWLLGDKGEIYTGENLIRLLKVVEGKEIDIYWLSNVNGDVYKAMVFDQKDGRFICEALPKPKGARAPIEEEDHHKQATEIFHRYQATVTSYMQLQKNAIDAVTIIDKRTKTISNSFTIPGFENFEAEIESNDNIVIPAAETDEFEYEHLYITNNPKDSL